MNSIHKLKFFLAPDTDLKITCLLFQLRKENVVQKPVVLGDDEEDGSNSSDKAEKSTSSKAYESTEDQTIKEEKEEGEISPTLDDGVEEVERRLG